MFTMSELFDQAWSDVSSALIRHDDCRCAILYGIRMVKFNDGTYEIQAAYDGDYYRPLPTHMADTMLREGWRKGTCLLAIDRCDELIDKTSALLNKNVVGGTWDRKMIERTETHIRHTNEKRLNYLNQIQNV
jgi:hypothetical protein